MQPGQNKLVLTTGISGQDGFLCSLHYLKRGYQVVGITKQINQRVRYLQTFRNSFVVINSTSNEYLQTLKTTILQFEPGLILHWASPQPAACEKDIQSSLTFVLRTIECIFESAGALSRLGKKTKVFVPGSSEVFKKDGSGKDVLSLESEKSPYAMLKIEARALCRNMSESVSVDTLFGILFSHESPLREQGFLTRQIFEYLKNAQNESPLIVGSLQTARDWSWAIEVIGIIADILEQCAGYTEYVIGSGVLTTLEELINLFSHALGITNFNNVKIEIDSTRVAMSEICGSYAEGYNVALTSLKPTTWVRKYVELANNEFIGLIDR